MSHKKLSIYGITFAAFMFLLVIYTAFVIRNTREADVQRLNETISVSETQIRKNVEYRSKDLFYDMSQYDSGKSVLPDRSEEDLYLADSDGVLHKKDGIFDGRKIDTGALKAAASEGYSAFSITNTKDNTIDIGLILPFTEDSDNYLVQITQAETFLSTVTDNLPISAECIMLFDEWGNPVADSCAGEDDSHLSSLKKSITEGASVFNNRNQTQDNYQPNGFAQSYNVYLKIVQPERWFLGTRVEYADTNLVFSSIPAQSIVIFILLIVILSVVITLDIINDREKAREMFLVSNIDSLTGLVNSAGTQEAFQNFIQKYPVSGYDFICMDIIAFSRINAMFGYSIGDMVLRTISSVIKDRYFCGARINADCFTFFAKHSDDMIEIIEASFYDSIRQQIGEEYNQMIAFKFGIYPVTESRPGYREVFDGAMLALKNAKKQIRQTEVVYDNHLKTTKELQNNIEINMMHALSKEEFLVYVQPQFDLPGEGCLRGETLIRWQSEFMGFLPPDKFIPIFENNGFIVETDFFMLSSALEFLEKHLKEGKQPITLAVNQSKVTISFPNYYERIKSLIQAFDIPLQYIELEVTESTLEDDWEVIVPLIHSLKRLGFSIAMDDFGSGFSSLNTLRILPIDILKIDKSFLQESATSNRSKIIIRNIINMAKDLHIKVVCEGVENEAQLKFVKEAGCDIIQGYYYSKPIPMEEFSERYLGVPYEEKI